MNGKGWRLSFSVVVMILMIALAIKWMEPPVATPVEDEVIEVITVPETVMSEPDLRMYFPPLKGMTYYYAGDGMEFASLSRRITFVTPGYLQVEDLSGTNLAQVVEYGATGLKVIWSEEEFYETKSLLEPSNLEERETGSSKNRILLQAPIVKGHTWNDEGFRREIVATDEVVTVPLGTFYEVVVVKSRSAGTDDFVQYEYYAKNVGLIKRESLYVQDGETVAVVSSLKSLRSLSSPQFE